MMGCSGPASRHGVDSGGAMKRRSILGLVGVALLVVTACGQGPRTATMDAPSGSRIETQRAPKRITASITANLTSPRSQLNRSVGTLPGAQELEQLLHAGLSVPNHQGQLQPVLAEAIPTLEN